MGGAQSLLLESLHFCWPGQVRLRAKAMAGRVNRHLRRTARHHGVESDQEDVWLGGTEMRDAKFKFTYLRERGPEINSADARLLVLSRRLWPVVL